MSGYSATLTITVPVAQRETGKRISRALDPDVGGYGAFSAYLDFTLQPCLEEEAKYVTYSTPCTGLFLAQSEYMLMTPDALYAAVKADYEARWPECVPPTIEECTEFCASIVPPKPTPVTVTTIE